MARDRHFHQPPPGLQHSLRPQQAGPWCSRYQVRRKRRAWTYSRWTRSCWARIDSLGGQFNRVPNELESFRQVPSQDVRITWNGPRLHVRVCEQVRPRAVCNGAPTERYQLPLQPEASGHSPHGIRIPHTSYRFLKDIATNTIIVPNGSRIVKGRVSVSCREDALPPVAHRSAFVTRNRAKHRHIAEKSAPSNLCVRMNRESSYHQGYPPPAPRHFPLHAHSMVGEQATPDVTKVARLHRRARKPFLAVQRPSSHSHAIGPKRQMPGVWGQSPQPVPKHDDPGEFLEFPSLAAHVTTVSMQESV